MKACIIYDTKRGSTTYFVKWIKEGFEEIKADLDVDVKRVNEVENFDYELFVIGSPIYWERPLKTVIDFLSSNGDRLKDRKIAIFVVCMAQLFGRHTESYVKKRYLMPLEEKVSGKLIGSKAFRGWLKKSNYKEKEKVVEWIRYLAAKL